MLFGKLDDKLHPLGKFLVNDLPIQFFKMVVERLQLAIVKIELQTGHFHILAKHGLLDSGLGQIAISPRQAAGSQFDTAKITHHSQQSITELLTLQVLKDRFACCSAGFAGIVKPTDQTAVTENTIGIHHMTGGWVLLM